MTTPGAAKPLAIKRQHWITAEALRGYRERVKGCPQMEDDQLADHIDELIVKGINGDYDEDIIDDGEPATLVMIQMSGSEGYYALLKKSNNKKNYAKAAVTILTQSQVGQYRKTKWEGVPGGSRGQADKERSKVSVPQATQNAGSGPINASAIPDALPVPLSKRQEARTYLLSYVPIKNGETLKREYEEWSTPEDVETRLAEIKAIPNTIRVYKELPVALKIIG